MELWKNFDRLVVFDTETTGIEFGRDRIIEIGAVALENGAERWDFNALVRLPAGQMLPTFITELTGITDEQLDREGVDDRAAAEGFCRLLEGAERPLLVAYNAQFDLNFLYYLLKPLGLVSVLRKPRFLDALTVYRDRRDYPHKLCNAIEAYGLTEAENSHRAVDDARATVLLLEAMAAEKQEKLLSAAVREFTERPYNEASINRIVREAGIPRGSFYMYFRDKEDLFHYLMEESINEMLMVFEEVLHSQGGDIFAALPAMYDHLRSRRSADRSLGGMGMMSAIVNRNDGLQKGGLLEFLDPDHILKRMEGCVNPDLLDLREPEDLNCILRMLIALIVPIMYNGIRPETDPEDREKLQHALEILRRGMGAKTHPAQRS